MNLIIKNYHSGFKVAKVCFEETISENCVVIQNHMIHFTNDDNFYPLFEKEELFYECLNEGDIISVNEFGLVYQLFDVRYNEATIFITGKCNSNCIMCPCSDYERKNNDGMSNYWMNVYIDLLPENLDTIVITGGEPTLKLEQFCLALKLVQQKFPEACILILSNGRSFSSNIMMDYLIKYKPKNLQVAIPIHASYAKLHDYITQSEHSFKQSVLGIHNLLSIGADVEIRIVVSKLNVFDLENISEFICTHFPTVRFVNFVGLETLGNCAKYFDKVFIPYEECFPYMKPAINILVKHGIETALYNYPLCVIERGYWSLCRKSISPYKVKFLSECDHCDAKSFCGGFFASTVSVSKPKIFPIRLRKENESAESF